MIYPRHVVYSLEALGYMATLPSERTVKVKELAVELGIPKHFLGKVLTELVKKKFVNSTKGPTGGFSLAVNASSISIYRILAVLNGLQKLEDQCVMGLSQCNPQNPCALHELWTYFKDKAIVKTQKLTLEEFSQTFAKLFHDRTVELTK